MIGETVNADLWMTLLKSAAMLAIVLGIMLAVMLAAKRFLGGKSVYGDRGIIKMLASHYVAPKERVALMEVMGRKILIGVTQQQISFLANIDAENVDSEDDPQRGESHFIVIVIVIVILILIGFL